MVSRGEIYLVDFGAARGREQAGLRPAVIVQNDAGNAASDTTIVAQMTARRFSRPYKFHVEVAPEQSGFPERSTILLEQMQTVSVERLRSLIGRLPLDVMQEVDRALHFSLGLLGCPTVRSSGP